MRTWTKSACVVLAWSILPIILMAIGGTRSVPPAHASTRTASSTEVILTSLHSAPAASRTAAQPRASKYVVQYGDTLSSIATRFGVHGGWPALYAANRRAIGPDPNAIRPGLVLRLPRRTLPGRYTVAAGDTLSGIAAQLALPGGWLALYEANWPAIGPNPNTIHPGTVLTIPSPAAATPPSRRSSPGSRPHLATPPPVPGGTAHPAVPGTPSSAGGLPTWLKMWLLAVGLLAVLTFITEPLLVARRRRSRPAADQASKELSRPEPAALPGAERSRIVLADHDRLVVTCDKQASRVFVLRPPGEDPRVILRVARVVLPEGLYGELAKQLGVPAVGPVE